MQAEEIHAQAAPAPEGASGGPEEAHAPDQAQPRRAASAPMPEVGQGAEAFTVGSFANAVILGVNAAFQQGQVIAAQACWLTLKTCVTLPVLESHARVYLHQSTGEVLLLCTSRQYLQQACKSEVLGAGAGRCC